MITDDKYQIYAGDVPTLVPEEHLKHIINVMIADAALNMGCNYDQQIIDRVIWFIQAKDFNYLPLAIIASAFARGSLGKFGAGRLVPRTIYEWLSTVAEEYRLKKEHDQREAQLKSKSDPFDLHRYPVGQAIIKKTDWLKSGNITEEDYDRIPLKELSERLAQGLPVVPELFGVESKNKNYE